MRVCAVVPTYNRRTLLLETLAGLAAQERPCDSILVLDNASDDGTFEAVQDEHPDIEVVRNEHNTGSAGGFGGAAAWAVERDFDWVWLLDNDSIPAPDALAELLYAYGRFPAHRRPLLLASKVVWTDGSILPLNVPIFKRKELDSFYFAAEHGTLSLRAAPYAGLLIHHSLIAQCGLPIQEYFLWNDDIEWTGRLLHDHFGVLVPTSVLCHKTSGNPTTTAHLGPRFFFEIRNKIWMLRGSDAFRPMEKTRFAITLGVDIARFFRYERRPLKALAIVLQGLVAGLRTPAVAPSAGKPVTDR